MSPTPVSFCMSTYRRPEFLSTQLTRLLSQTFTNFHIVVSDNDPDGSAKAVVEAANDPRIRYFHNSTNLGMVKSFNKSLERATTEFVVMVTDDDPVYPDMLKDLLDIIDKYPGYAIYCGCKRAHKDFGAIEVFDKDNFVYQLLNPDLTKSILWSSCILRKDEAVAVGGMADYGSPHLADHALLALCSRQRGGVMVNRMYSEFASHQVNFSKTNFDLYYVGCKEFYSLVTNSFPKAAYQKGRKNAVIRHLEVWFIAMAFNLRRFYAHSRRDKEEFRKASISLAKILDLPFMKGIYPKYLAKRVIFYIKFPLYRLSLLNHNDV